jgi:hypothetical protein
VIAVGDSNVHGVAPHIFADAAVHDFLDRAFGDPKTMNVAK